jgi:hypothetical protein
LDRRNKRTEMNHQSLLASYDRTHDLATQLKTICLAAHNIDRLTKVRSQSYRTNVLLREPMGTAKVLAPTT